MPPIPLSRTHSSIEGTYINNDYDDIPGGASTHHKPPHQEHILYAEINSSGGSVKAESVGTTDSLERSTTSWNDSK